MKKLFVGNLDFGITEGSLEMFIREFGILIKDVKVIRDAQTGRSRGFGFVELDEAQDLDEAIETLDGKNLEGRGLRVNEAQERSSRGPRGGGGKPGGGSGGW